MKNLVTILASLILTFSASVFADEGSTVEHKEHPHKEHKNDHKENKHDHKEHKEEVKK